MTIDIGANDIDPCAAAGANLGACLNDELTSADTANGFIHANKNGYAVAAFEPAVRQLR